MKCPVCDTIFEETEPCSTCGYNKHIKIEELRSDLARLKAENERLREFVLFLVKLSVNMMYEGNMPTIDEIDALMETSKEWLDENEWRSCFVL